MAREAILKIKEAEDSGSDRVKKAAESAKLIVKNAEIEGEMKFKELVGVANKEKQRLMDESSAQAAALCAPLLEDLNEALKQISSPDPKKLTAAVELIVERIVSGSGNC